MKKGLIIGSFGTTDRQAREKSLDKIFQDIEKEVSYPCVEAYTSRIVKKRIIDNENIHKLNEIEAVKSLKDKGIEEIYIQPIHVITGFEYEKLKNLGYKMSKSLFHEQTDYKTLIGALEIEDNDDITIFVGHGSNHQADKYYSILEKNLQDIHGEKVFVSTIEGEDDFENLLKKLEKLENKSILLRPLMLVAGVHVRDDLSSSEENSWKSKLEKLGYKIDIDKRGLGELKGIRDIFVEKAKELIG